MTELTHFSFDPILDDGSSKYFITYFGDIYAGFCHQNPGSSKTFYIIQQNKSQEFRNLSPSDHTPANLRKFGREIPDKKIITGTIESKTEIGTEKGTIDRTRTGDQKWKRMFVFGAGASAFCQFGKNSANFRSSELRPPIGFELFDETYESIISNYPGVKDTIPFFEMHGNDIEVCLELEWFELIKSYNPQIASRHINIQYYLQDLFCQISKNVVDKYWRTNLYSLFATKLQKYLSPNADERIAIISFNYDTILDAFLERIFGFKFNTNQDYIDYNNRPVILFKPHGSCNWGWPFKEETLLDYKGEPIHQYLYNKQFDMSTIFYQLLGSFSDMVYKRAWGIEMQNNIDGLGKLTYNKNKIKVISENKEEKCYPALLLPYRDKDEFLMHYDHQHTMRWFSQEVEELYLIGWKGNEDVFNRMLKSNIQKLKKIVIVNPDEKIVLENLKKHDLVKIKPTIFKTFEDFVINHLDKMLND